jgi:hypothetical protein
VYDTDVDFGALAVIYPTLFISVELLPSQKLSPDKLAHLDAHKRVELLHVLDQFPETFSEIPGLRSAVEHRIPIKEGFQPKRLKAYKVPTHFKSEVSRQINELPRLGFIK